MTDPEGVGIYNRIIGTNMNQNMSVYKPDCQESRMRMINWLEGKGNDRVVASVTSPIFGGNSQRTYISDVPAKYVDYKTVFNNLETK